jgi:mycothiol synthase
VLLGYGAVWPEALAQPDGRFRLDLVVEAGREQQLWDVLEVDLRRLGAESVLARAPSNAERYLGFLAAVGFVETQRMHRLELVLDAAAEWQAEAPTDWTIVSLAEARRHDERLLAKWWALEQAVRPTWPEANPLGRQPPPVTEAEAERRLNNPALLADAFLLAEVGECFVGFSALERIAGEADVLGYAGTGVDPAWRGRGVATDLKRKTIELARQHGYRRLRTATANPAMLAINERLGFQRRGEQVRLVRRFA